MEILEHGPGGAFRGGPGPSRMSGRDYPQVCQLPTWSPAAKWPEAFTFQDLPRATEGSKCLWEADHISGILVDKTSVTEVLASCQGKSWVEHHLDTPGYVRRDCILCSLYSVTLQSMWLEVGVLKRTLFVCCDEI